MTDLDRLIDAAEAGRDDSEKWRPALGDHGYTAMMAFHGDLNAAKRLHDALLLDDYFWTVDGVGICTVEKKTTWPTGAKIVTESDYPARAWLLSILKAYRSIQA